MGDSPPTPEAIRRALKTIERATGPFMLQRLKLGRDGQTVGGSVQRHAEADIVMAGGHIRKDRDGLTRGE